MYVNVQKKNIRRQSYSRRPSYDHRYYGRRLYLPYSSRPMARSMALSLGDDYDGLEGWFKNTFGFSSGINIKVPKINIPKFLRRLTHKVPVIDKLTDWSIRGVGMFSPITWIDKGMREEAFKDWKRWGSRIPQMAVGAVSGCAMGFMGGGPVGCAVGAGAGGFIAGTTKGEGFKFKLFKSGILPGIQGGGLTSIAMNIGAIGGAGAQVGAEAGAQVGAEAGAQVGTQVGAQVTTQTSAQIAAQSGVSLATPIGSLGPSAVSATNPALLSSFQAGFQATQPSLLSQIGSGAWSLAKGQLGQMALQQGMGMIMPQPSMSPLDEDIWDVPYDEGVDEEDTYVDEGPDTGLPGEPGMQTPVPDPGINPYLNPYSPYNAYSPMSDPRYWGSYPQYGLEYPVPTVPAYVPASGVPLRTPYGGGY